MQQVAHRCTTIQDDPPSSSSANSRGRYNPRVNYGKEKGKRKGKSKIGSTKKQILATKELILLPSPKYNKVPRFERKRRLQERGLIIDGFPFDKSWDERGLEVWAAAVKSLCKAVYTLLTMDANLSSLKTLDSRAFDGPAIFR